MLICIILKLEKTFESVRIFRYGFQHSGFLITVILIMKKFKNVFEGSQDL